MGLAIRNIVQGIKRLKWKDLDPHNKHGDLARELMRFDKHTVQPVRDSMMEISMSVFAAGTTILEYLGILANKAPSHDDVPLWLKIVLSDLNLFQEIDLSQVSYHEKSNVTTMGLVVGYNIFFREVMHLDRPDVDPNDLKKFLHELQHVVQYKRGGGAAIMFPKVVHQYDDETISLLARFVKGDNVDLSGINSDIHDDQAMEAEAVGKVDEIFDKVWQGMMELEGIGDAPRIRIPTGPPHKPGLPPQVP